MSSLASSVTTLTMSSAVTIPFIRPSLSIMGIAKRCSSENSLANDSEKVLLGIEHVGIVDRFNLLGLPAQIRDRLVHGHVGTKTGETGTHQTAGIIFRVGK